MITSKQKREYQREYQAKWRAANPERYRATCKKSQDKNRARINERNRDFMRRHRAANLELYRGVAKNRRDKQRGKPPRQPLSPIERYQRKRKCDHRYCEAHRDDARQRMRTWKANNRERARANERRAEQRQIAGLGDSYLRKRLATDMGVSRQDIPSRLIEAKRAVLKVKRLINERQEQTK